MFSEKTECIGVDEVLRELRYIKSLLDVKDIEMKVEVPNTTSVTVVPDHVPVWDVTDADFEVFPSMPDIDSKTEAQSKNNNTESNDIDKVIESIVLFIDDYPVVFGILTGLVVILVLCCCSLCWYRSIRRICKKEHVMVIEHPHFFGTRTPTPLTNVSPILRRMSMYRHQYMEPIPLAQARPMSNQQNDDESVYYEDPQVLRNQNARLTTEI